MNKLRPNPLGLEVSPKPTGRYRGIQNREKRGWINKRKMIKKRIINYWEKIYLFKGGHRYFKK